MSENKKISIEVDGVKKVGFDSIGIKKSMTNAYSEFYFNIAPQQDLIIPYKEGDSCKIWIGDKLILSGYIETSSVAYSSGSHTINFSGRDVLCDFVDSSLTGNIDFKAPISIPQVLKILLPKYGLANAKIINQTGLDLENDKFTNEEDISSEVGDNAFEFVKKLCLKKQVLIYSNGIGDIILTRAENAIFATSIKNEIGENGNNNNIISGSKNFNTSTRFGEYNVFSQGNASSGFFDGNLDSKKGSAFDNGVRTSRIMEMQAESLSSIESCEKRAVWEANVRRAKAQNVTYTVKGFYFDNDVNLWDINRLVFVNDFYVNVSSNMLIASVEFSYGLTTGEKTSLTLLPPDAFQLQASPDPREKSFGEKIIDEVVG